MEGYRGKRVLLTGHTGFKGGWLTFWLSELGAKVFGYALAPQWPEGIFTALKLADRCDHALADVRDLAALTARVKQVKPELVFHLAAQPLVRLSYEQPLETLTTNVLGTANLFEAVREARVRCPIVIVTSDKCYDNREWAWGYRENDPMGGKDVYSMSKGAAELVTASWRSSFFPPAKLAEHGVALATARAGNVIGGGDQATDRIVVDCVAALRAGKPIGVRNPGAVRPWQHVLEPLSGYLRLGEELLGPRAADFSEGWNFGPANESARSVQEVVEAILAAWGQGSWEHRAMPGDKPEANFLRLAIEKAQSKLGWTPRWNFATTVAKTIEWYRAQAEGADRAALEALTSRQLAEYQRP